MTIFARFRRNGESNATRNVHDLPPSVRPRINQRITVIRPGHPPVPSRVEDETDGSIILAAPTVPLELGEPITMSWEAETGWLSLDTTVTAIEFMGRLPVVEVAARGRVLQHDDRRSDVRLAVELPIQLRPVIARVAKQGMVLTTHTVELSGTAVRFATSAPFAPGDLVEARIDLGPTDSVSVRVKVIRVDATTGSWRQICTATFDEMLRSDRARIRAWLEVASTNQTTAIEAGVPDSDAGVVTPGYDEPLGGEGPMRPTPLPDVTAVDPLPTEIQTVSFDAGASTQRRR